MRDPRRTTIGFIGVGLMGAGMADCLNKAGHRLVLMAHKNRDQIEKLLEEGAHEASDLHDLVARSKIVITCVPNANVVERLAEHLVPGLGPGKLWIDTTTSRPQTSHRIAKEMRQRGTVFADAPVTGGPPQARAGQLASLVGCRTDEFESVADIVGCYSKMVRYFGEAGSAHAAKLLNNLVTQGTMLVLTDAFQCAESMNVDQKALYDVMTAGAARSGTLEKAVRPALDENFDGSEFTISNAAKDVSYALDLLREQLPGHGEIAEAMNARMSAQLSMGRGDSYVSRMLSPQLKLE